MIKAFLYAGQEVIQTQIGGMGKWVLVTDNSCDGADVLTGSYMVHPLKEELHLSVGKGGIWSMNELYFASEFSFSFSFSL